MTGPQKGFVKCPGKPNRYPIRRLSVVSAAAVIAAGGIIQGVEVIDAAGYCVGYLTLAQIKKLMPDKYQSEELRMEKQELVERYKKDIIKKAAIPADIAQEMAEDAFDEFGEEDTPEDSVDSELSYWGD